jgi:hypothetical protein
LSWDAGGVEGRMVRVAQRDVGQTFVFGNEAVADDLDLRLMRDCLEVGMQDGTLGVQSLAMAVAGRSRVEEVGEAELGSRGDVALALEEQDLVREEGSADRLEVGAWSC